METLSIRFKSPSLTGRVAIPGSKSLSNRLLVLAYLGGRLEDYHPDNLAMADDTVRMRQLLTQVAAHGVGGANAGAVVLDCANAGTVLRFLTALLAFEPGEWLLDGSPRMRRRPIAPLVETLQAVGADIRYTGEAGYPPLLIRGLNAAAVTEKVWPVDASMSSQYVSALMLAACRVEGGARLRLTGERTSQPYIRMTAALLRAAGVEVGDTEAAGFTVCGQPSGTLPVYVEPDWSSASYFYGLLALSAGGALNLPGLRKDSCQGDRIVAEWFEAWGIESRFETDGVYIERRQPRSPKRIDLDFTHHPDLLQTMAVVCAATGVEARFTGVRNLKYKETDRVAAVIAELNRLGVLATSLNDDEMFIPSGRPGIKPETVVKTYGDHRMALAFSMWAMLQPITIENPAVVGKSFEGYWTLLEALGAEMALR